MSSILLIFINDGSVKYAGIPFTIAVKPAVDCKLTKHQKVSLVNSCVCYLEYIHIPCNDCPKP